MGENGFTFSFGRNNKTAGRAAGVESVALAALVHCDSVTYVTAIMGFHLPLLDLVSLPNQSCDTLRMPSIGLQGTPLLSFRAQEKKVQKGWMVPPNSLGQMLNFGTSS